ncbi:hypothetical protein [Bacillus cereus group sp. BfR-BA-01383]|uniref:hypothetical protein n=1 Tax=Bacillus cereus group sp. BfR-BA-01383 TaxID=2920327 RepID=UPI001F57E0E8|nr:hypothetical protein [Bacillus cereus group sp. BfR-BA-01383]
MGIAVLFRNLVTPNYFRNCVEDLISFTADFEMTLHIGSGYFSAYTLKKEDFYKLIKKNHKIKKVVIYGGNLDSRFEKDVDRNLLLYSNENKKDYKDGWNVNLIWMKNLLEESDIHTEIRIPKDDINWHAKVAVLQCNNNGNSVAETIGGIVGSSNLTNHAYMLAPPTFNMEADTFIYNPIYEDYFINALEKIHRTSSSENEKNTEQNENTERIEIIHSQVDTFNKQDEDKFLKEVINSMQQSTVSIYRYKNRNYTV